MRLGDVDTVGPECVVVASLAAEHKPISFRRDPILRVRCLPALVVRDTCLGAPMAVQPITLAPDEDATLPSSGVPRDRAQSVVRVQDPSEGRLRTGIPLD